LNNYRQDCSRCGYLNGLAEFQLTPEVKHYGKLLCPSCGAFWRWVAKPDGDQTKYKRPKKHKELVKQFGNGFCEMCLTEEGKLPANQSLEGHHVIPYRSGGSCEKDNVWILCTRCHRQVELIRTYNPTKAIKDEPVQPNPTLTA